MNYNIILSQKEIDALWISSRYVGGNPKTHRKAFSSNREGSIYELFGKNVSCKRNDYLVMRNTVSDNRCYIMFTHNIE